jgi:hypothetical protein
MPGRGGRPGMPGMGGMPGMPGMGGLPGMPGVGGQAGGTGFGPDTEEEESAPYYVRGIIEANAKDVHLDQTKGGVRLKIKHKYGLTYAFLPPDGQWKHDGDRVLKYLSHDISLIWYKGDTVNQKYEKEKKKLITQKETPTAEGWVSLAQWALHHGRLDEVPKIMANAIKADPQNPSVVAFQKMQAAMAKELPKEDPVVARWRERLGNYKIKQRDHYTLLYDVPVESVADSWLQHLEDTYQGFVYWFALKGKTLKLPEQRLVGVLISEKDAFEVQHKQVFEEIPLAADSFHARRDDNVAFYCAKRMDEQYDGLNNVTKGFWQSWDRPTLLAGKGWGKAGMDANMTARAQTLVLLLKILEDEAELASASHGGTRQLLAAVTLEGSDKPILPRSVEVPWWVQYGMAACFETPLGAFWRAVGAPNEALLTKFILMDKAKKLDKPEDAIRGVVTDRYFYEALKDKEPQKAMGKPEALAWSLAHFLLTRHSDHLFRYFQDLARLPRDLEFDEDQVMLIFARAFDLQDAGKPDEINQNKLGMLAREWYQEIRRTHTELSEVLNQAVKEQQTELKGTKNPPKK